MGGRAPRAEWRLLTGLIRRGHQVSIEALSKYADKLNQIADAPDLSKRNCFSGAKTTVIVDGALLAAAAAPIERKILRRKVKLMDKELNDGVAGDVTVHFDAGTEKISAREFSALYWDVVREQESDGETGTTPIPAQPSSSPPSPWKID